MKKMYYLLFCLMAVLSFTSCSDDDDDLVIRTLQVQLQYPENSAVSAHEGVTVNMKNATNGTVFTMNTNAQGIAKFDVPEGLYEVSATDKYSSNIFYNGVKSDVTVNAETGTIELQLQQSVSSSIIIKELYFGGCKKDDGKNFIFDQYVVLYNNSSETVNVGDLALAMAIPANAAIANKDYVDGVLSYAKDHVSPAGTGVWYFEDKTATIEPGKELKIAICGAIDNTQTVKNSVDLSKVDYCFYDIEDFSMTNYYPAPSESIPASHYMKAYKYPGVTSKAWGLSTLSPAFFIFKPEGTDLKTFVDDPVSTNLYGGSKSQVRKMVPESWIVDAVEVFQQGKDNNVKRLTAVVDAGAVMHTNSLGHSVYRNVDKEATEAIAENKGKLVYNYAADPSGIDAEASIKNGARIVYMDTNNSTKDFHEREKASLK